MKAHEETWTAHPQGGFIRDGNGNIVGDVTALDERNDMSERTLLMAAAPDMARALLAMGAVRGGEWHDGACLQPTTSACHVGCSNARTALKKAGVL